jgi:hypothetical protein
MADCLATLIGIAPNETECFTGIDEDYLTSDSGYYMTHPAYGIPNLNAVLANPPQGASDPGVFETLNTARQLAITELRKDLTTALHMYRESAYAWRGVAAKNLKSTGVAQLLTNAGAQIYTDRRLHDMTFVITDLYIGTNFTGTVDVNFASNNADFSQAAIECNTVANTWNKNTLATAVSIPLYNAAETELYYNLYMNLTGTDRALNAQIWCCGGPGGWKQAVEIGGFNLATIADRTKYRGSTAYGIILGGYLSCAPLDWICNLDELNGYSWKQLLGVTLLYKATMFALSGMLQSGQVNQFNLLNAEISPTRINELAQAYATNIEYIAKSLPAGTTSCFGCGKSDFSISKIRS